MTLIIGLENWDVQQTTWIATEIFTIWKSARISSRETALNRNEYRKIRQFYGGVLGPL